jgi:sulfur carrier protein ThiS
MFSRHMQMIAALLGIAPLAGLAAAPGLPGTDASHVSDYHVLSPLHQGSLTVFPVVSDVSHETSEFITLDEGIRSGTVVVSEAGSIRGLVRRGGRPIPIDSARVNQLVLVNNSDKPLLLLAGEIVTGGKQDRVVGKDRIVPAQSDPVELGVFCVEPGRWTGASSQFKSLGAQMAQPSVRAKAMVDKNQQAVWDQVNTSRAELAAAAPQGRGAGVGGGAYRTSTSYAQMVQDKEVQKKVDEVALPVERNYSKLIKELRSKNAVGVVVAVNGEIVWADIFASTSLLEKYWPKLVRSYAAETIGKESSGSGVGVKEAQRFLDNWSGTRETIESEPGIFRHTEISGDGFRAFELTSLLPKTGFDVHLAKAAEGSQSSHYIQPLQRPRIR